MSKMVIIEGNSNNKDDVRAYMVKGERGYSAYEIAVRNGYEGTEAEWKESFLNPDGYYTKEEVYNKEEAYNKDEVYSKEESYNKEGVQDYVEANRLNTNYVDGNTTSINSLNTNGRWRIYIQPNSNDHNYLGWYGNAIIETFVQQSSQACIQRITQMTTGDTYTRNCATNEFSYNDTLRKINSSDLVNYKLKGDFAVITGNATLASGLAETEWSYPSGFNKSNCVVISFMANNSANSYWGNGYIENAGGYAGGAIGHRITLKDDNIGIAINNPTDGAHNTGTAKFYLKLLLMKVS